jgi:hypothetical protein
MSKVEARRSASRNDERWITITVRQQESHAALLLQDNPVDAETRKTVQKTPT